MPAGGRDSQDEVEPGATVCDSWHAEETGDMDRSIDYSSDHRRSLKHSLVCLPWGVKIV